MIEAEPATRGSKARLFGTLLLVIGLIAIGIVIGARLYPRAVTVEHRIATPIRVGRERIDLLAALPDLIEQACPAMAAILLPDPMASPVRRRRPGKAAAPVLLAHNAFFVSDQGYLVTASDGLPAGTVKLRLDDGRLLDAQVTAVAPVAGLALLKAEGEDFPPFSFARDDYPRLGTAGFLPLVATGQGCSARPATIASDFIAERSTRRAYVRVTPGSSPPVLGAPLVNALGQVIGVALPDPADPTGVVYLPGNMAGEIVEELMRAHGIVRRPLGLTADDLSPALARRLGSDRRGGVVVVAVEPGSPADAAGIQAGDVVIAANGGIVAAAAELSRALSGTAKTVPLTIARNGRTIQAMLTRSSSPAEN